MASKIALICHKKCEGFTTSAGACYRKALRQMARDQRSLTLAFSPPPSAIVADRCLVPKTSCC